MKSIFIYSTGCFLYICLVLINLSVSQYTHPNLCTSDNCACMTSEGLLDCNSKDAIPGIPVNIPQSIRNIVIQSGAFPVPAIIRRQNLTSLNKLKRIKIISSHLTTIEARAFFDLRELIELDLSKNKLGEIKSDTFAGLRLDVLRLDYNYELQLNDDSFRDLKVETLSLRSCGLTVISYALLSKVEFKNLELYNNSIRSLEPTLASFLLPPPPEKIRFIDLSQNPLHCACDTAWLGDHIRKQTIVDRERQDLSVTCGSPASLKGQPLALLRMEDLQCFRPTIREVTIDLNVPDSPIQAQLGTAKLTCIAEAPHKPDIHLGFIENNVRRENRRIGWRPDDLLLTNNGNNVASGNDNNNSPSSSSSQPMESNAVELNVSLQSQPSQFYCMAGKQDGSDWEKVELRILLSSNLANSLNEIAMRNKSILFNNTNNFINGNNNYAAQNPMTDARFTLLQLLLSILVTFVITIALTFIACRLLSYYCPGRGPWRSASCSSSHGGSTYSTVKCPLPLTTAHHPHHNNNTIHNNNMIKSTGGGGGIGGVGGLGGSIGGGGVGLLSGTTGTNSDYDVPQYISSNGHAGGPPLLPYPSHHPHHPHSHHPGIPYPLPYCPHSRTMSSLRLESLETAAPTSLNTSFIDFKTQQEFSPHCAAAGGGAGAVAGLWPSVPSAANNSTNNAPSVANIVNSTSQPHALHHSSQRSFIT